jgi:hypothetical protein
MRTRGSPSEVQGELVEFNGGRNKEEAMKRRMTITLVAVMTIGWLGTGVLGAQTAGGSQQVNISEEQGDEKSASAVSLLGQAGELVRYARENESPLTMLAAVEMLSRVRVQEARDQSPQAEPSGEQVQEGKKGQTAAPTLDRRSLLTEAKAWAQGDEHVMALINAELAKPESKPSGTLGAGAGPIRRIRRLPPRTRHNWTITFKRRSLARVIVIGDGDTDLDLYVYDQNGNLIVNDSSGFGRNLSVRFTPRWTGRFTVRIINRGRVYNTYLMATN